MGFAGAMEALNIMNVHQTLTMHLPAVLMSFGMLLTLETRAPGGAALDAEAVPQ